MFLLNSLRSMIRGAYSPRQVRRRLLPRRPAQNRRLAIEILEDRTLPSAFTVLNLADSGAGSLSQAVVDANAQPGADTIRFAGGLHGTIVLTSGELDITGNLTIEGPGATHLTISGNDASRVFDITANDATVTIAGLTIAHGRAATAAGIDNAGATLTVSHCTLSDNQAVGVLGEGAIGGGIYNEPGATLAATSSGFVHKPACGGSRGSTA